MADASDWGLGWTSRDAQTKHVQIEIKRQLSGEECERFFAAHDRLSRANMPAMFSVLALAFETMGSTFSNHTEDLSQTTQEPAALFLLQYQFTGALAAFSYFRAYMEKMADEMALPELSRVKRDFQHLAHNNRYWRLLAQLRNIDQHHPPALRHITLQRQANVDRTEAESDFVVRVNDLIEYARGVTPKGHLRQWDELEALWAKQPTTISLAEVIDEGLEGNYRIAIYSLLAIEDILRDDIFVYLKFAREVDGMGSPILVRYMSGVSGGQFTEDLITYQHVSIDPRIPGLVAVSINKARRTVGLPPRFNVARNGNEYSLIEFA